MWAKNREKARMTLLNLHSMNELNQEDNRWGPHLQCQVPPQPCWWYPEWRIFKKVLLKWSTIEFVKILIIWVKKQFLSWLQKLRRGKEGICFNLMSRHRHCTATNLAHCAYFSYGIPKYDIMFWTRLKLVKQKLGLNMSGKFNKL